MKTRNIFLVISLVLASAAINLAVRAYTGSDNVMGLVETSLSRRTFKCEDSDGGKNYAAQGTVSLAQNNKITQIKTDLCTNNKKLKEFYCKTKKSQSISYEYKKCDNACAFGACVEIAPTPTPTPTQSPPPTPFSGLKTVEVTLIQPKAHYTATFQSHNQKVVGNNSGIFLSYRPVLSSGTESNSNWKIMRSVDGGTTFNTAYEETINIGVNAPAIDTDGSKIFALVCYYTSRNCEILTLNPPNYNSPQRTTLPDSGIAGKYAMIYDGGYLFVFLHSGQFYKIRTSDMAVVSNYRLIVEGGSAVPQYPYLNISSEGTLIAGWTTVKKGTSTYWNIGFAKSLDRGATWQKADGSPLVLPIIDDETGSANIVNLSDEFAVNTWLESLMVKNNKAHFAYLAHTNPVRYQYVRYDLSTGLEDKRIQPEWKDNQVRLSDADGFPVNDTRFPNRIYWISGSGKDIEALYSDDNGSTWRDLAKSSFQASGSEVYAIGGYRNITGDGYILGSFGDYHSDGTVDVYFFKINVQ